ncbi:phage fiber-tail adaptor protein [Acetobacter cibinongensis]
MTTGVSGAEAIIIAPAKHSADSVDYTLEPASWLSGTGDHISQCLVSVRPDCDDGNFTICWSTVVNGQASFFVGGGVPSAAYFVLCDIQTQQGRFKRISVTIPVVAYSPQSPARPVPTLPDGTPVPPNAIQLPDGSILTDDSGTPFIIA